MMLSLRFLVLSVTIAHHVNFNVMVPLVFNLGLLLFIIIPYVQRQYHSHTKNASCFICGVVILIILHQEKKYL